MKRVVILLLSIVCVSAQTDRNVKGKYGSTDFDEFPFDNDKTEKSFTKIPALLKSSIVNSSPEFVSASFDSVYEDSTYLFNILTNDPDGNDVELKLEGVPSWMSIDTSKGGILKNLTSYVDRSNWNEQVDIDGKSISELYQQIWVNQMTVDSDGNIYFTSSNHVIYKIDINGMVSRIAGKWNTSGYSGDNGPANESLVNGPYGIDVDKDKNIYFADKDNYRIRKIGSDGIITTIAGTGEQGATGDNGLATLAKINYPQWLQINNNGEIYFSAASPNLIRKIDTSGIITTVAGKNPDGVYPNSGKFEPIKIDSGNFSPHGIFPVDIDLDSDMDFVAVTWDNNNRILLYTNDGSQNFSKETIGTDNIGYQNIKAADLDNDGDIDIIPDAGIYDENNDTWFGYYTNDGSQNFSKKLLYKGSGGGSTEIVDLDGDGKNDIIYVSGNNSINWLKNNGGGSHSKNNIIEFEGSLNSQIMDLELGDFDNDSDLDIIFVDIGQDKIIHLINNGSQTFSTVKTVATNEEYYALDVVDLDKDGLEDFVLSSNLNFYWYKNSGENNFEKKTIWKYSGGSSVTKQSYQIEATDIDKDGDIDIFTAGAYGLLGWLENDGSQNFSNYSLTGGFYGGSNIYPADIDKDGDIDILTASYEKEIISWYKNLGRIDSFQKYLYGRSFNFDKDNNLVFLSLHPENVIYQLDENNNSLKRLVGLPGRPNDYGNPSENPSTTITTALKTTFYQNANNLQAFLYNSNNELYFGTLDISSNGALFKVSEDNSITKVSDFSDWMWGMILLNEQNDMLINFSGCCGYVSKMTSNGTKNFIGRVSYFFGEGISSVNAVMDRPRGIATDSLGNLFIADQNSHRIRKIDTQGVISTVAGTGGGGYSGDGGLATSAQIYNPRSVTADNNGNLYISDKSNNRIRKVDTNGIISTYAGTGESGYSGDGGAATLAKINFPYHLTTDQDGNLYFAEYSNHIIRKVDTNGIITTVAGTPENSGYSGDGGAATSAKLNRPLGVDIDLSGNIYIADYRNHVIRKVNTDGIISTIAGTPESSGYTGDGDVATSAKLNYPAAVNVDNVGNIYINDRANYVIRKVWKSGIITTIAGTGTGGYSASDSIAVSTNLSTSYGLSTDNTNNVYISGYGNSIIRKVDAYYHTLTGTPTNSDVGSTTMTLTASDDQGGSATQSFALKVINTNDAPALASVANVTTNEDTAKTVTLSGTDVDGDALTYTGNSNTDKVTISISSTTMTLTPAADWYGTASITAYVSDGTVKDSTSFTLTVASINDVAAINTTTIEEDASATVTLSSTFSGTPTYSAKSDTSAITVSVSSATLQLTPSSNWNGTSTITAYASVGTLKDSTTFTLSVTAVNDAPVITAVANDSTDEEIEKAIKLIASDIEGDALTYTASSDTSAVAVTISTDTLKLTPALNYTGTSVITVIVSDNVLADTSKFDFKVINVNDAPVITAVANDTTSEDSEGKALKLSASDIDGDALTYSAVSDTLGLTVTVSNDTMRLKPVANYFGTSKVKSIVNDGMLKDSTTFSFTVLNVQDAPYAFDWVSTASDTIDITKDAANLAEVYKLEWTESIDVDGDTIDYLLYAKIGVLEPDEIYDTTSTSVPITYQEFVENVFEPFPMLPRVTVQFSMEATDGIDTVKITGDNRVLFINRYEYLSTVSEGIPTEFALHENYPNPFNPTTTLRFDLPEISDVTLTIYNMLGQRVKTFNMQGTVAGYHTITWDATNDFGEQVGAGVYLYQLQAKDFVKTRKMVLLK